MNRPQAQAFLSRPGFPSRQVTAVSPIVQARPHLGQLDRSARDVRNELEDRFRVSLVWDEPRSARIAEVDSAQSALPPGIRL